MQDAHMLFSIQGASRATRKTLALTMVLSLMILAAMPSMAQLQAAGTISSSQRWQASDSPVRITDDLVIENGAVLTIDPGVRVEVVADASLTVRNGALYAVGTPSSRIVITSAKVPAQAEPGDWGALRFEAGTFDAQSALDHVIVEYGSGIALKSASPVLRNLTIRNHAAPAISLDTDSSPMGEGLAAVGNTLDGILVSAGVVTGNVVWGLRGIPYVVRSGTVEVGALGFALAPERLRLVEGVQGRLEVTRANAAPAGGMTVTIASSVPSVVSAPASVVISEGATRADIQISAVGIGSAIVTASGAGFDLARAEIEVVPSPQLQLPAALTLNPDETQRVSISLSERAPDAGLQIAINNSASATVVAPALVEVPPRARSVQVDVRGIAAGAATLTLSAPGWENALTSVVVRGRTLILPNEVFVRPGRTTTSTVSVAQPVEGQALLVTLSANQTGIVGLPPSVTIPVGQTSATFTVDGLSEGFASLSATGLGYDAASTTAVVERLELAWDIPTTYDASVGGFIAYCPRNFPTSARIRLNRAAPVGGVRVLLRSAAVGSISFPITEFVIAEGETQLEGLVRLRCDASALTDLVAESDEADEGRQRIRVGSEATLRINNGGTTFTLGRGMSARPSVVLEADGQFISMLEPVTVGFTSSDATRLETTESVVISRIGQPTAGPLIAGKALTSSSLVLEGRVADLGLSARLDVTVIAPQVSIEQLDVQRSLGSTRDQFLVNLRVDASDAGTQWLSESIDAQVSIVDASPEGLLPGIFSSASGGSAVAQLRIDGGSQFSQSGYVGTPTAAGTYRVRAVVPGVGSQDSDLQQVVVPSLSFSRTSGAVAVGMRTSPGNIFVTRQINQAAAPVSEALTVSLEISDGSKAAIPASVTIPANAWSAELQVDGLAVSPIALTIRATAPNHDSGDVLQLKVLDPTLRISGLDDRRNVGGARDWFQVAAEADDLSAIPSRFIASRSVSLSLVTPNPADVVAGFYAMPTGSASVSAVTIPAGQSAVAAYVGEGQKAGVYRVRAESPGTASAESAEQRISATEVKFSLAQATVGIGLEARYYLYIERRQDGQLVNDSSPTLVSLSNPRPDAVVVPTNVTIPANVSRVEIPLRGISSASNVQVLANGLGSTSLVSVSVVTPTIQFNVLDGSRALSSGPDDFSLSVGPGDGGWYGYQTPVVDLTLTVELIERAPENVVLGLFADFEQSATASEVVIPVGQSDSSSIYVGAPSAAGSYRLSASAPGLTSVQSDLQTVVSAQIVLGNSGASYQAVGRGLEKPLWIQFSVGDGDVFYNEQDVTVSLECLDATICGVESSVIVPASCSECSVGTSFALRGLQVGSTRLRASAPGFEPVELDIHVRRLVPSLVGLPGAITAADSPPSFSVRMDIEGDRAFGEDDVYVDEEQFLFSDLLVDVASDVPNDVGLSTPTVPGKISIGPGGYESATIVLPTPRVPVRATITASGTGLVTTSQEVLVE